MVRARVKAAWEYNFSPVAFQRPSRNWYSMSLMVVRLVGVYSADEFSEDALFFDKIFDLQELRLTSTNRKVSDFSVDFIDAAKGFGEVDGEPYTEG